MKNFKSGFYVNQGSYKSFQAEKINRKWELNDMELINLLGKAERMLGKLDMYSEYIPNIDLFISMHVVKEATESSKIEGTRTNLEEAVLPKDQIKLEKRDDWEEVQNYIKALNAAIDHLVELPFSSRLIKNIHAILLQGVRGENKMPGEFRRSQNWIGGASFNDAIFVPPVHTSIADLMGDLENFAHNELHFFPDLLKAALIHYQFETIHPFLDGNGRIGRLIITLFLVERKILSRPILYLSDFFSRHRSLYFDNLMRVREKSDLLQWFKFFLVGIIETAENGIKTFDRILKLKEETRIKILQLGSRAENARIVINSLFQNPSLTDPKAVKKMLGVSLPTAYKLIDDLESLGIIEKIPDSPNRGNIYIFRDYLKLFI